MAKPIYIKLGGSLITDKRRAESPRMDVIDRLAQEIADVCHSHPQLPLVIGHGSGSFGHVVASQYGTRAGIDSLEGWYGFSATGDAAARLSRIVVAALLRVKVSAWSIQPGVALRVNDGQIVAGPEETVALALARGLIPVVFGDVALDAVRGGTIASTEEIFDWLTAHLPPRRIILLGEVDGVYDADPQKVATAQSIPRISPENFEAIQASLGGSHGTDVTGGMIAKVAQSMRTAIAVGCEVVICSGLVPGHLVRAIENEDDLPGTVITGET